MLRNINQVKGNFNFLGDLEFQMKNKKFNRPKTCKHEEEVQK